MTLVDNYKHKCIAAKIRKLRARVPTLQNSFFVAGDYSGEAMMDLKGQMKGETFMTKWSTISWFPELWYKTSAVVSVAGRILVMTQPKIAKPLKWSTIFSNNKMGVMLPRYAPAATSADEDCYHQLYRLPQCGGIHFPRPFCPESGPLTSTTLVKTSKNELYFHSANYAMRGKGQPMNAKMVIAKYLNEKMQKNLKPR
jgi:hypothetical protein